ncbi:MAG TPA: glycosyltransferase [bacterium]|nr:glycosyltransferase [bacterium]
MKKRLAIISEAMLEFGGGDRLLSQIAEIFPDADIYTPILSKNLHNKIQHKLKGRIIEFSSLRKLSILFESRLSRRFFTRLYNTFGPIIYENLDLTSYKNVLTLSSRYAHGVITTQENNQINLFFSPSRYEWDNNYINKKRSLIKIFSAIKSTVFRVWDYNAAQREAENLSISRYVAKKVKKYYGIDSEIVYPFISDFWFADGDDDIKVEAQRLVNDTFGSAEYFLILSRLYDYKKIDELIMIFRNIPSKNLLVVGEGPEFSYLKTLSSEFKNIKLVGYKKDEIVRELYRNATATFYCSVEDFGLSTLESMAAGTPVIGNSKGGFGEIIDEKSGVKFSDTSEIARILTEFDKNAYVKSEIVARARSFSVDKFVKSLKDKII